MEFLASDKAQFMYAQINGEYAVKEGIPLADSVKAWGNFKRDGINLTEVAAYRAEASRMADRIAFDD
jgi:iron(III) transport system substrate-binding protein